MDSLSSVEVVELYLPRRLEYLSPLYEWLRDELHQRDSEPLFRGFSLYEVAGAFQGEKLYTEQTLVVRLVFDVADEPNEQQAHQARIKKILSTAVEITGQQEESIWIIHTAARRTEWRK